MAHYPNASGERRCCVFVTVLWGHWHREIFLNTNLPTMLSSGNLPALNAGVDCEYLVYTTPEDARIMSSSPSFQRLREIVRVSLKRFTPSKTKNVINLHHEIWGHAIDHARRQKAFILLMPPDVAWADGSFAQLGEAIVSDKHAIFMTYPRVVSETMLPALAERFPPDAAQAMTIPPRELMKQTILHIHPLMAAYDRAAAHFPIHPEMILWPVEGDGFLLRLLARELFCFEPERYPLNAQSLLAQIPSDDEIHVFDDSREFLGVSFTPLWKDMEWYLAPRRLDPLFVGGWWTRYDSPVNDRISKFNLRFTCGTADEARWRLAEARANTLISHLRSAREFLRVISTLDQAGHKRAAAFLAAALRTRGLARRWPHRGPFLILAPTDEAFRRAGFKRIPGDGLSMKEILQIIEAHVAVISTNGIETLRSVRTLAGHDVQLKDMDKAKRCGDNILVSVGKIELPGQARETTE
jgi:hypothetical protein